MVPNPLQWIGMALAMGIAGAWATALAAETNASPTAAVANADVARRGSDSPGASRTASRPAASNPAVKMPLTFDEMDKNHDGYIDSSEAAAMPGLIGAFDGADRDKDGKLDRAEFGQGVREWQQSVK